MSTGNKLLLIFGGIIIIVLVGLLILIPAPKEESGTTEKPQEEMPEQPEDNTTQPLEPGEEMSEDVPSDVQAHIDSMKSLIVIESPKPGSVVTSPLTITGKARGTWFFEASFPVSLVNWDGLILAEIPAQAQGEWMTEEFVPFETTIVFETPEDIGDFSDRGTIILKKDNPSGLPENDAALEIPVRFR